MERKRNRSGGGRRRPSIEWPKPSWQIGTGVPADGHRDVPDVSLSAASHDGYLIFLNGALSVVGGTSASSPSLAALFTLANQKYSSTQGNINPVLYMLALKQAECGGAVFYDITSGNNSVPGVTGSAAGFGYDLASGLGSVDALQLVNHWKDVAATGAFTLTPATTTVSLQAGQNATISTALAVANGFNWPVALSVSGQSTGVSAALSQNVRLTCASPRGNLPSILTLGVSEQPAGVTASFSPATLVAGSGVSTLTVATTTSAAGGSYSLALTVSASTFSQTLSFPLTVIIPPSFTLTAGTPSPSRRLPPQPIPLPRFIRALSPVPSRSLWVTCQPA